MKAKGLNPAELRAVAAMLEHPRHEEAAKAAGLSLRTFQRYLARDAVQAEIAIRSLVKLRRVTAALGRHAERATEVLGQIAAGEISATSARVRACTSIVEFSLRAIDHEDTQERLREIEQRIATLGYVDLQKGTS